MTEQKDIKEHALELIEIDCYIYGNNYPMLSRLLKAHQIIQNDLMIRKSASASSEQITLSPYPGHDTCSCTDFRLGAEFRQLSRYQREHQANKGAPLDRYNQPCCQHILAAYAIERARALVELGHIRNRMTDIHYQSLKRSLSEAA